MYNPYAQRPPKDSQPIGSNGSNGSSAAGSFIPSGSFQSQPNAAFSQTQSNVFSRSQQARSNFQPQGGFPSQQSAFPSQQSQQPANGGQPGLNLNSLFADPATQMGLHFSQTAFNASQQYMQQNLKQFVSDENIKYYFKVSNSYVLRKLLLILFPYRNKSWTRQFRATTDAQGNAVEIYATPIDDVNAPDLYIPSMALVSYILFWAVFSGFKGDFHPQLLGYALTRTLAFYILDVLLLKLSFYALAINSKNAKIWDLVSYSGYKFITTLLLMIVKNTFSSYVIVIFFFLLLLFSLGFFLMRSLRYAVLPSGMESGSISSASKRLRTQFLFVYAFILQAAIVWIMA
ncbi:DEKNAAC101152 [Brettanomyces naardenensis]|uniref:Protein YIF1 n=1 Tax=Brettanomyces naardenensis TaxID=13370 RepID=A0A448YHC9_BRENA|nr:DEKNAAC101152 [Brettanomyces naardenensis]